jgi:hypothetical protein
VRHGSSQRWPFRLASSRRFWTCAPEFSGRRMHGSMQNVAPVINGLTRAECSSWHSLPRSRIPSLIARDCLATVRERLLFCCLSRKKQVGITTSRGAWPRDFGTIRIRKLHVADRRGRSGGRWLCQVKRIVCAIDCGMYVNPDTIEAQIQGGTLFGLTAALHGSITSRMDGSSRAISTAICRCVSTRCRWWRRT